MKRSSLKTLGIRIRERSVGESDALIDIFTEEMGTLNLFVPGLRRSRKRFPGSVRKFCIYSFDIQRTKKDRYVGKGARYIEGFDHVGLELNRHCAADYILQVLGRFYPEGVNSREIFSSLKLFFRSMNEHGDLEMALRWIEIRILGDSGFMGDAEKCNLCGRLFTSEERSYFQSGTGKFICNKCPKSGNYIVLNNNIVNYVSTVLSGGGIESLGSDYLKNSSHETLIREEIVKKLGFYPRSLSGYRSLTP